MSLAYIRDYYNVPAVEMRRVICSGKPGVIMKAIGPHIGVLLDGEEDILPYHPTHEVEYGDLAKLEDLQLRAWRCLPPWRDVWEWEAWFTVHAPTRAKARYRAYRRLREECDFDIDPKSMCYIKVRVEH